MSIWNLQGAGGIVRELKFYPSFKEIFNEISWKSNTILDIPSIGRSFDQRMAKPLTEAKKDEDYEICVHLNTFTLDRDNPGDINPLRIALTSPQ